ncbi:MAG: GNAT family N-acetyltransferase, partial [SAR324 cluster bacterium]|nr:GNAT family N-acetyltransferase [SAR324 cluster bacterium]
ELFLVGMLESFLTASVMGVYDGHRVWINYLAIHLNFQCQVYGQHMMENVEAKLRKTGCPKINL